MHSTEFTWLSDEALIQQLTASDPRPNLMIVAHELPVEAVADHLLTACAKPLVPSLLPGPLHLPTTRRGTLLLQNVAGLSLPQQILLNDWIDEGRGDTQIVSIAAAPLWDLVQDGDFLEGLFYRLNVVHLDATARSFAPRDVERDDDRKSSWT